MITIKIPYRLAQICFFWMVVSCPDLCSADIYKFIDENGVTHFTNAPNNKDYVLIIKGSRKLRDRSAKYDPIIADLCNKYDIDKALVKAIVKTESDFDPRAISKKGAKGLMQLMPPIIRECNLSDPFHPEENLEAGIRHLRKLVEESGARGVVFYNIKFCEPELFHLPIIRKDLKDAGIPSVVVEADIGDDLPRQVETSLETFMEVIK